MTRNPNPQTKEKLLDAAEELMLQKGFTATTVDDICQAAGLTKGSFFHYFASKNQIAIEAVRRFYARGQAAVRSAPFRRRSDPLQRVYGYFDFFSEMARHPEWARGCLLGTLAQELADTNEEMRAVCATCFADWAKALREDLELAKARYAPRARWKTQSLADHCIAVVEGALILVKSSQDLSVFTESLAHLKRYLTLLFQGKNVV